MSSRPSCRIPSVHVTELTFSREQNASWYPSFVSFEDGYRVEAETGIAEAASVPYGRFRQLRQIPSPSDAPCANLCCFPATEPLELAYISSKNPIDAVSCRDRLVFRALTPVRPASLLQAGLLRGPFGGYLTKIESTFARLRRYRGSLSPSSTECAGHCVKPVVTGVARFSLCLCQGVGSTF